MKKIYTGLESAGKTLLLARDVVNLVNRNKKWFKKYGFKRVVHSNLNFSDWFYDANSDFISYWEDMSEVLNLTGCDIIWDEISSDFSALKKEPLARNINRWLRQGAKQGVHIYATAQEFHDVALDFRRRCSSCYRVNKLIGSSRSGENLPKVKTIWGVCLVRELDIRPYNELEPKYLGLIPDYFLISKELCMLFDTHQVIKGSKEPLLEHIVKECKTCGYKKIIHR